MSTYKKIALSFSDEDNFVFARKEFRDIDVQTDISFEDKGIQTEEHKPKSFREQFRVQEYLRENIIKEYKIEELNIPNIGRPKAFQKKDCCVICFEPALIDPV
jgi:hypothetical protein